MDHRDQLLLSQMTCEDHVKWITDEKSRKDRSVSKGETMSLERDSDLKRRFRIGDCRHRCKEKQQRSKGLESRRWRNTTWVVKRECSNKWDRDEVPIQFTLSPRPVVLCAAPVYVCCWKGLVELCVWCLAEHCHPLPAHCYTCSQSNHHFRKEF